jgi:general stress protein 26
MRCSSKEPRKISLKSKNIGARVKQELREAGVTGYGLMKSESRYLPQIIHEDEHIMGVVYGQYGGGSAMLVATDHRVIFLDRKPLFTTMDELTYDVVSGVKLNRSGFIITVMLHTRIADYTIRYANSKCADIFVKYIESRRLEKVEQVTTPSVTVTKPAATPLPISDTTTVNSPLHFINESALAFLRLHDVAVLSSVDRTGNVYGAVIYYLVDQLNRIYILTKSGTAKARNILSHSQVSLTIFEADKAQTLTLQGFAEIETDQKIKDFVFSEITKPRAYQNGTQLPPVTKLTEGAFTIIRITATSGKYTDYNQVDKVK